MILTADLKIEQTFIESRFSGLVPLFAFSAAEPLFFAAMFKESVLPRVDTMLSEESGGFLKRNSARLSHNDFAQSGIRLVMNNLIFEFREFILSVNVTF